MTISQNLAINILHTILCPTYFGHFRKLGPVKKGNKSSQNLTQQQDIPFNDLLCVDCTSKICLPY